MMIKLGMRGLIDLARFAVHANLLPEYRLPTPLLPTHRPRGPAKMRDQGPISKTAAEGARSAP